MPRRGYIPPAIAPANPPSKNKVAARSVTKNCSGPQVPTIWFEACVIFQNECAEYIIFWLTPTLSNGQHPANID
jgi:hypothetical protein